MLKKLCVYIDRLREGGKDLIEESLPVDMFGQDKNFYFTSPIVISGEAYLAGDYLLLSLQMKLDAALQCIICNNWTTYSIYIENFLHTEPLPMIKNGIYDYSNTVREAIFLEIPAYSECNKNCPERSQLTSYLGNRAEKDDIIDLYNKNTTPFQYL